MDRNVAEPSQFQKTNQVFETNFDDSLIESKAAAIETESCLMRNDGRMNPAAITSKNYSLWVTNELVIRWSTNQDSNRKMRESFAQKIFILIGTILIIHVGLIVGVGMEKLRFSEEMLKWIIGSFGMQMVGAFSCIVKYLFSKDDNGVNKMFDLLGEAIGQTHSN